MVELPFWSPMSNGFLTEDHPSLLSLLSSRPSNPHPLSIGEDCWLKAEQTTQEIICRIQPTVISEQRRLAVIDYVQRLIRHCLGAEVFPFGSVPLKTYLPDGDIDLTALCDPSFEAALANDVCAVLEGEEQNNAAEFEVRDVQYIHAEVKLVKCLIQNIVVDISFNQMGGLCTLCFLELVDHRIGKDHLFKRSIILIKAWCYYESRILGAHHGLISTYALETLVLYIFHLFHSSLNGPLSVLCRFLDYFSKFDWDNYCISLNGPVCISSLPEIVAETPENDEGDWLLSKEFLNNCINMFSVPLKGPETKSRAFTQKHLNIIDPLKENNNLGRSVSKGNFFRIRSAFTYGARKLGRILLQPKESIADEVNKFFMNTLDRHGSGQRPDVQDPFGDNGMGPASSTSGFEKCRVDKTILGSLPVVSNGLAGELRMDTQESLYKGITDIRISGTEKKPATMVADEPQRHAAPVDNLSIPLKADGFTNGVAILEYCRSGDVKDLVTSRTQGPRITNETSKSISPSREPHTSLLAGAHHASHPHFLHSFPENGDIGNRNLDKKIPSNSGISENKISNWLSRAPDEELGLVLHHYPVENELETNIISYSCSSNEFPVTYGSPDGLPSSTPNAYTLEDFCPRYKENDSEGTSGSPKVLNSLSDLSGDYGNHLRNLSYGRWCLDAAISGSALPIRPPSPSQMRSKSPWDTLRQSVQWNVIPGMNVNGIIPGSPFYPSNSPLVSGAAFCMEETSKPRGMGTYFPNTNHLSDRVRFSHGRGRNPTPATHGQLVRPPHNNDWGMKVPENKLLEKGGQEPSLEEFPALPGRGKLRPLELNQAGHPHPPSRWFPHSSDFSLSTEHLESGSCGQLPEVGSQPDSGDPQDSSTLSVPSMETEKSIQISTINLERVAAQSYHLKDENDFPPLSF